MFEFLFILSILCIYYIYLSSVIISIVNPVHSLELSTNNVYYNNNNNNNKSRIIYVDGLTGSDDNTLLCNSLSNPCKTILHAITIASDGDTIIISNSSIYYCNNSNSNIDRNNVNSDNDNNYLLYSSEYIIKKYLYFVGWNTTIDCNSKSRIFVFINVPVSIYGFNMINGYTSDDRGGSAIYSKYDENLNISSSSSSINNNMYTNSINSTLEYNSFKNHINNIGSAVNFNYYRSAIKITHFIKNCIFINNTITGAMNIRYFGNENSYNSIEMINTHFINNTHTNIGAISNYQATAAGGINIVYGGLNYSESQQNSYNRHSFIHCTFIGNIQSNIGDNALNFFIGAASGGINIFTISKDYGVNIENSQFDIVDSIFEDNIGGNDLCIDPYAIDFYAFGASAIGINSFSYNVNEHYMNSYNFINNKFRNNKGGTGNSSPHFPITNPEVGPFTLFAVAGTFIITDIAVQGESNMNSIYYIFQSTNFINNTAGNNNVSPLVSDDITLSPVISYSTSITSAGLVIAVMSRGNRQITSFVSILMNNCNFYNNSGGDRNSNLVGELKVFAVGVSMSSAAVSIVYTCLPTAFGLVHTQLTLNLINSSFINNRGANLNSKLNISDDSSLLALSASFASSAFLLSRVSRYHLTVIEENLQIQGCWFDSNTGANDNIKQISSVVNNPVSTIAFAATAILVVSVSVSDTTRTDGSIASMSACSYRLLSTSILNNMGGSLDNTIAEISKMATSSAVNFVVATIKDANRVSDVQFEIKGCEFVNNRLIDGNGGSGDSNMIQESVISSSGALYIGVLSLANNVVSTIKYTITQCSFINNRDSGTLAKIIYSRWISGAIAITYTYPTESTTNTDIIWNINECIFRDNSVGANESVSYFNDIRMNTGLVGGLLLVLPSLNLLAYSRTISGCEFSNNYGISGGALQMVSSDIQNSFAIQISDSQFVNNFAVLGGAIFVGSINLTVTNSIFSTNTAYKVGGAIFVQGQSDLALRTCYLKDNIANDGASDIMNSALGLFDFYNSTIYMSSPPSQSIESNIAINSLHPPSVDEFSKFICSLGYEVFLSGSIFGCRSCGETFYNIIESIQIDNELIQGVCLSCPFGGICHKSNIVSSKGFWGSKSINGSVLFTSCPNGYCNSDSTCLAYNSCSGNRGGILCGECSEGYAESISSINCVSKSDECGSSTLGWFIPVCLLLGTCVSIYFLSRSKDNSGFINIIIYFYQGGGLIFSQQQTSTGQALQSILFDLFSFQVGVSGGAGVGASPEICISNTLTAVNKQVFYIISPVFIVIPLCFLIVIIKCCCNHHHNRIIVSIRRRLQDNYAIIHSLLRVCLFMYSSIVLSVSNLLHCIMIENIEELRLFRAASIICYQPWQQFLFMILALILAIPLLLLFGFFKYYQQNEILHTIDNNNNPSNSNNNYNRYNNGDNINNYDNNDNIHHNNHNTNQSTTSTTHIMFLLLSSPYTTKYLYWESILLIWRLYSVLISTFVTMPTSILLYLCMGNFIMFSLHVYLQPFRNSRAQLLQTLCLTGLLIMTWLGLPSADLTSNASSSINKPINSIIKICFTMQIVILFVPVLVLFSFAMQYFYHRCKINSFAAAHNNTPMNKELILDNYGDEVNSTSSFVISDSYRQLNNSES